jgi:hypothetical protein
VFVNVESEEKFYTQDKHMCINDGFAAFFKGELMCGTLGKKTLGGSAISFPSRDEHFSIKMSISKDTDCSITVSD